MTPASLDSSSTVFPTIVNFSGAGSCGAVGLGTKLILNYHVRREKPTSLSTPRTSFTPVTAGCKLLFVHWTLRPEYRSWLRTRPWFAAELRLGSRLGCPSKLVLKYHNTGNAKRPRGSCTDLCCSWGMEVDGLGGHADKLLGV